MRNFIKFLICIYVGTSFADQFTPAATPVINAQTANLPQTVTEKQAIEIQAPASASQIPIVISGTVPDEATHQRLIAKVRHLYGDNINDQMLIGKVMMPPNWVELMDRLLDAKLKGITRGELKVSGTKVKVRGEVANEAQRQQIVSEMSTRLNPTYTIHNGLHVAVRDQSIIDDALANRNIEFESNSANLTPSGKVILDGIAIAMIELADKQVDITGHTDNIGLRPININLSLARADSVKQYLSSKGVKPERCNTYGMGPDRPIANNTTVDGRSRNRRIEFRVVLKN